MRFLILFLLTVVFGGCSVVSGSGNRSDSRSTRAITNVINSYDRKHSVPAEADAPKIRVEEVPVSSVTHIPAIATPKRAEVKQFIRFYASDGRSFISDGLQRRPKYLPLIEKILAEYNLPMELANVPFLESRYLNHARSPQGAAGMWQFMSPTAKRYGLEVNWLKDERLEVEQATHAAAKLFVELYDMLDNWDLVLAAYNSGIGTVSRAIRSAGTRDFFELSQQGYFGKETREYIPKFHAISEIMRNRRAYGFANYR